MNKTSLRITEIFFSLQGESTRVGLPTVFVRLTGCPLRCNYCDTAYAFKGGKLTEISDLISKIKKYNTEYICITGGEPLAQPNVNLLMQKLIKLKYQISLETSGAIDISKVAPQVMIILDLKTPASGEVNRNIYENLQYLKPGDQIKFVICDKSDFIWAKEIIIKHNLTNICEVLFSPSFDQIEPEQLANWILADSLKVRMQVQLHKILWGNVKGK